MTLSAFAKSPIRLIHYLILLAVTYEVDVKTLN